MLPKREPGLCLNTYTATICGRGIRKLRRNRGGTTFLIPCLGVQHVLKIHFLQFYLDYFPGNIGAVSEEHEEGSIRTYPEWKKDRAANGTQICWLDACTGVTNRRI
jgi:hypothetical protein